MDIWEGEGSQAGVGKCVNPGAFGLQRTETPIIRDVSGYNQGTAQGPASVWLNPGAPLLWLPSPAALPQVLFPRGGFGVTAIPVTLSMTQGRPCANRPAIVTWLPWSWADRVTPTWPTALGV